MAKKSVTFYLWAVVILGILAFLTNVLLHSYIAVHVALRDILYILAGISIFLAGRNGRARGRNSFGIGTMLGAIYGFIIGLSPFFFHISAAEAKALLQSHNVSTVKIAQYTTIANSTTEHVVGLILATIMMMLLGFIVSFIGGATAEKPTQEKSANEVAETK